MIALLVPVLGQAEGGQEAQRFLSKVQRGDDSDCWPWIGGSTRGGYGIFHLARTRIKVQAHRYAYELLLGSIPEGLTLDHLCRNRACVNPSHLEPVTNKANILRGAGVSARNRRKTQCPHGHAYTEGNTYVGYDGRCVCRECQRKWHREKMRRRRSRTS